MKRKSGIIFAADLQNEGRLISIISEIADNIDAIKIGYPLVLSSGIQIVKKIKNICDIPIIADFKIMDTSVIATTIVKIALYSGCDGVMLCGVIGPTAISDCIEIAGKDMTFVFTEFTQPDGLINPKLSDDVARIAKDLGAYGIQAPGTKPDRIKRLRDIVGSDLKIISCGIGAQGPPPGSAIKAGADFEIIGRAIYDAKNPKLAVKEIGKKISDLRRNTND